MNRILALARASLLCLVAGMGHANAAEITCLSPGALESAFSILIPQFEQASGHKIVLDYASAGVVAGRIGKGETVDVVILPEPALDALRQQGKLAAGGELTIARVGVGVFVRKGDPRPDVGSVETFRRSLLSAGSIAYSDPALGGTAANYVAGLMGRLGIAAEMTPKTRLVPPAKPLADLVAGGGAEFGLNQISEILADPRLDLVGPLPAEIQSYTRYAAGLLAAGTKQAAGKAWIDFLVAAQSAAIMRAKGFEPL
jgi:molybdate transport system substrate-binding protein